VDFSAAEKNKKARGVKFYMHVGLLYEQVFSPFAENWLAGSHGGGCLSRAGRHPTCHITFLLRGHFVKPTDAIIFE